MKTGLHVQRMPWLSLPIALAALAGCASQPSRPAGGTPPDFAIPAASLLPALNRVTWGASTSTYKEAQAVSFNRYLQQQLHPANARLPAAIDAQIRSMTITQRPMDQLVMELEQRRKQVDAIANDDDKKAAQQAYQDELNRLAREAAARSLLRDAYSSNQLQEQLTWFWMNHFNIHQGKHNLRAMVGDYEEHAIRPHALGKFRDLLRATVYHPAMLRYLDNEQNAAGHLNENYARELMELHTLGVNSGYTQNDVQELARILTGLGVNLGNQAPNVRAGLQGQYVRRGLFEFNPNRHDYGDKVFLGQPLKGRGLGEVDEALDRLCRSPATALYLSRKLAVYFTGNEPPQPLTRRMADTFLRADGDIAATLAVLFASAEFRQSLGRAFKDPVHYVVSAVRMAYDDKPILNANPMAGWLYRMGEPLYGRQTPDGYPLSSADWQSSGQMTTRFEIAKSIGSGSAGLFKSEGPQGQDHPAFPQLATPLYYDAFQKVIGPATRHALEQAVSPQEWNSFLLASPEFMFR
ncbi:DUF1800 domain-containing protein [Noviherbaspirillum galbum]|uniref:DUF1800 domain-containing protein n=1 Tax=Noviherbaspirillum galbum TaxID=2709383 RepID=A0A6B3SW32_9BURK|nr:DUF1800 domain-containing protein [Noviherbaspirillum galbum]NEX64864.1 DUF1800 domain-containing protein [Noviherbaspirillum galbum]